MPYGRGPSLANPIIDEYEKFMRTEAQKARRKLLDTQRSAIRRAAGATEAVKHGIHWFDVGKSDVHPCKKCGLGIRDKNHKDAA
jgi:hypothetical protein